MNKTSCFAAVLSVLVPTLAYAVSGTVSVDASKSTGVFKTVISTQLSYQGAPAKSVSLFEELAPASPVRIHMNPYAEHPLLVEKSPNHWDFAGLDSFVNQITGYGGRAILNPKFPPPFMWSCSKWQAPGTILDTSYNTFGDYLARLVGYYNKGRMTTEDGTVLRNPAGTGNRVDYWEIWNEPDLSDETPCKPSKEDEAISPQEYLRMWNTVVPKMLAVDPTLKLVGPTASVVHHWSHTLLQYIPVLLKGAVRKPDALSFHGYGDWKNETTDLEFLDGRDDVHGIPAILSDLKQVQAWAPEIPVWISELNVNAGWQEDPKKRSWTAFGTVWMCSAYYRLGALGGADLIHQFVYWEDNQQDSMVESKTGGPTLSYWRDYYVPRYFPKGSKLLSADSSLPGIEVMVAKPPKAPDRIRVMLINRQVADKKDVGGKGAPATLQVALASAKFKKVTVRMLDNDTPLEAGTPETVLAAEGPVTVSFKGYGVALLEFVLKGKAKP